MNKNRITGNLSAIFKSPELEIMFIGFKDSHKKYKAIIDTGAYDSHLRRDVLQDLNITSADGQSRGEHPNLGIIEMPTFELKFKINEFEFIEQFNLMATHYQYPIIIGSKFLAQCKEFHYYGKKNKFEIIL
jgi:hypothetical protein